MTTLTDQAEAAAIPEKKAKGVDSEADQLKRIRISDIRSYERNPRRQRNPEYSRIKASIRAGGLDQPLMVTQEPGADDYVLQAGGNTRLQVLKELFEETGDDQYHWVHCVVKPWAVESSLLFAHLRENELRGNLPFIDKARAVFDAKKLLEQELQIGELTQRQLERLFRERGYSLSHSMISKMGYAVHTLWPLMPKALQNGLGRPQVEKVRSLERAALHVWLTRELGDQSAFESLFAQLCRRYDTPEWDIQPLRSALETEMAEAASTNFQVIRLELDASQAGRPLSLINPDTGDQYTVNDDHSTRLESPPDHTLINPSQLLENEPQTHPLLTNVAQPPTVHSTDADSDKPATPEAQRAFEALRLKIGTCAQRLAEHHGLVDQVRCSPDQGLGFLLMDVPSQDLRDTLDNEALGQVNSLWWSLASCCDLTTAPREIIMNALEPHSVVYQAVVKLDVELLLDHVWLPDPGCWGDQLWFFMSDTDWQHLLSLMTHYRTLKRKAWQLNTSLWQQETAHVDEQGI